MAIFTHVAVGTNDLARARQFYDAVLAPLGYRRIKDFGDRGSCWGAETEEFMVLTPADGNPACPANGGTVSFVAPSRAAVAEFHKAALAIGGKDEGAGRGRTAWLLAKRLCRLCPRPRRQQARRLLSQPGIGAAGRTGLRQPGGGRVRPAPQPSTKNRIVPFASRAGTAMRPSDSASNAT
jgi:catechol 2,3-dioxygenase-like lactoylglutathione lyase family enzyme